MELNHIIVRGAREHNLKNITLEIPKKQLVVFTGVSGSGKSSLAFDTLYSEGQRRYVESLSSYARQFLELQEKPKYDSIKGLSPTIAIDQKKASKNPRSTVGTVTEIHDYLRILFARCGTQFCPTCDLPVSGGSVQRIAEELGAMPPGTRFQLLAPLARQRKGTHQDQLSELKKLGFVRVRVDGEVRRLDEKIDLDKKRKHDLDLVVDRLKIPSEGLTADFKSRLIEAVETALELGDGLLICSRTDGEPERSYSQHRLCTDCGRGFPELRPQHFSFNSPLGSCPRCSGLGTVKEIDGQLVVPEPEKSLAKGAVAPWQKAIDNDRGDWVPELMAMLLDKWEIDLRVPWNELSVAQQRLIMDGNSDRRFRGRATGITGRSFEGVKPWLRRRIRQLRYRRRRKYMEYFSDQPCPACGAGRLAPVPSAVRVGGRNLVELNDVSIEAAEAFFKELRLHGEKAVIAAEVLKEIRNRLGFLTNVGLGYLTLGRRSASLSGGESQRIRLASQVGSELCGCIYVLDEPSIGLHQRDNQRLLATLSRLRDIGNTVIVVEHDQETMEQADHIVDFGPEAGVLGGEIVAEGSPKAIQQAERSLTGDYLSGRKEIAIPEERRPVEPRDLVHVQKDEDGETDPEWLVVQGARENNLKSLDIEIPLGRFVCVTGVSGAGKSSLIKGVFEPALFRKLHQQSTRRPGPHDKLEGWEGLKSIIPIDQDPIGRTPRSNPGTYTKVFDRIRKAFANTKKSRVRGYKGRFSFNVKGGRCEECSGAGVKCIEMHFLPDVYVPCEECDGKRFNDATLRIEYKGHNIAEVLDLTIHECLELFCDRPKIKRILQTLVDVGMDYVKLGQPSPTLSGGEAQRIKLAKELSRRPRGKVLYLLDEPTTGLHFHDIAKLLKVLQRLVDRGHTVVVIEHNLDVIKCADWLIDLGPEGGEDGGHLVAAGTPEQVAQVEGSHTGRYLREMLELPELVLQS